MEPSGQWFIATTKKVVGARDLLPLTLIFFLSIEKVVSV